MTSTKIDRTAEVLKSMLTENTGRHFLDSGGAYGRAWERNQGRDFDSEPSSTLTFRWGAELTHNVYHWLKDRLTFNPQIDRSFHRFADKDRFESTCWLEIMREFGERAEKRGAGGIYRDGSPFVVNTYNGEDLLSQTIQYLYWDDEDGEHVLLQIHGGCDVRGGYTKPRAFDVGGPCGSELAIMDNARGCIYCDRCGNLWDTDDGYRFNGQDVDTLAPDQKILFGNRWDFAKRVPDLKEFYLIDTEEEVTDTSGRKVDSYDPDCVIRVDEEHRGHCPYCDSVLLGGAY